MNFAKGLFLRAFEGKILKQLNMTASAISEDAKTYARGLPKEIQQAIEVGKAESNGDGRYSISITVDLDKAPMARAYEFGSGEHATIGEKKKYRIPAEGTKSGLAFFWDKVDENSPTGRKFKGILPDGRAGFTFVEHPGVEAQPYLAPAIKENIDNIKLGVVQSFMGAIIEVTPRIEWIKSK